MTTPAPALTVAVAALLTRNAGYWTGTATDLGAALAAALPPELAALDASKFSAILRAAVPDLAAAGITIEPPAGGGRNGRVWTISRADTVADDGYNVAASTVPPVPSDTPPPDRLAAARADLRAALIAGHDTRTARAALASLEAEVARQAAADAAAVAEIERARQAAIEARAAELADAAATHLATVLAALEPPPAPVLKIH